MRSLTNLITTSLPFALAIGVAIIGANITGPEFSFITSNVEHASSGSANFLHSLSNFLPLGFAFTAGMVASVNPCGFSMLPSYLGVFLADSKEESIAKNSSFTNMSNALKVGSTVTISFILTFIAFGLPIGLGLRGLVDYFPWFGLLVGILLCAAGAYLFNGGSIYSTYPSRAASLIVLQPSQNRYRNYFLFGIAYAIASLSCTLPIFLAVIGGVFSSGTIVTATIQFALYGLGMGVVILGLTASISVFKMASFTVLQNISRHIHMTSSVLLLLSGSFIVYYWLAVGEIILKFNFGN